MKKIFRLLIVLLCGVMVSGCSIQSYFIKGQCKKIETVMNKGKIFNEDYYIFGTSSFFEFTKDGNNYYYHHFLSNSEKYYIDNGTGYDVYVVDVSENTHQTLTYEEFEQIDLPYLEDIYTKIYLEVQERLKDCDSGRYSCAIGHELFEPEMINFGDPNNTFIMLEKGKIMSYSFKYEFEYGNQTIEVPYELFN